MNTKLTIKNRGLELGSDKILVYLQPQENNTDWETVAWDSCTPQNGGSHELPIIDNVIQAYGEFNNGRDRTAYQNIEPHHMALIKQTGNEVDLLGGEENVTLTAQQSGVKNTTNIVDIRPIWCLNGKSICRPKEPLFNGGISSFELLQKIYFTIGSSTRTETFIVQDWSELAEFDIESNLVSADIVVSKDKSDNKPVFTMENAKYQ